MNKGQITLIMKDRDKGPIVSNYRPITCLPLLWKVFTGVISNAEIYSHPERSNFLPPEQNGCKRKSRATKDQLLVDKAVIKKCKWRQIRGIASFRLVVGLAPVVQKVDSAIHRINHYPLDSAIGFPNTYPMERDLSGG